MKKRTAVLLSIMTAMSMTLGGGVSALAAAEETAAEETAAEEAAADVAAEDVAAEETAAVEAMDAEEAAAEEEASKAATEESRPVVPAVVGLDKGYIMGYEDNGLYSFKGVAYGTHERFKYASPVEEYGTEERPSFALTNGSVSPQSNTRTEYSNWAASAAFMTPSESDMFSTESECLNLNIWTDTLDETAGKPVLVFMHGGGLENGSALELKIYDGSYFADYTDVVFVSVNARLNYVGYLDLTSIGGDANIGVSDMVLSLEWVRDNIAKFGGDPENVTILGQSGGGTKVTALASAPAAEGLFSKVANISGGSASGRTPEEAAENAGKLVDYVRANVPEMESADDSQIFQYLQEAHYDTLVDLCEGAEVDYGLTTGSDYFQTDFYTEEGGLNEIASQYTYLIGSVWAEMGGNNSADAVLGDWGQGGAKPNEAKCNISPEQQEEIMKNELGERYEEAKALYEEAYPGHDLYDLRALVSYAGGNMASHAANSAPAVYEYLVAYEMPYFGGMTMVHTADLGFWFHSIDSVAYQIAGDEENAHQVADTMASALAAFCTTGDPSTPELAWDAYTTEAPRTMILDVESVSKDSTFDDALQSLMSEAAGEE